MCCYFSGPASNNCWEMFCSDVSCPASIRRAVKLGRKWLGHQAHQRLAHLQTCGLQKAGLKVSKSSESWHTLNFSSLGITPVVLVESRFPDSSRVMVPPIATDPVQRWPFLTQCWIKPGQEYAYKWKFAKSKQSFLDSLSKSCWRQSASCWPALKGDSTSRDNVNLQLRFI